MIILHIASLKNNKDNGVNVVVPKHIINQAQNNDVAFVNLNGTEIIGLEDYQYPFNKNDVLGSLPERFRRPDIAVFHEVNNLANIAAYKALLNAGVPYVILPHGELTREAQRKKWLKKKVAYALFFNRFIRKSQALQCLSAHEAERIDFRKKKFVATNGIEDSAVKKESFHTDCTVVTYIGRLETKIKGLDLLCGAVAEEREFFEKNKVIFRIYGPDVNGRRAELEGIISELDIGGLIELHEPVYSEGKAEALLASDLYVQPSRSEGMPVGLLEAINIGLPSVYTEGTNLRQYENYDFGYFAETSVKGLASALRTAVESRADWARKSENGVKMTRENFDWRRVSSDALSEYAKIIMAKNPYENRR